MFRNSLQPKTFLKNTLAALLMITLSGAYCLFCCQEAIAAGSQAAHHQTSQTSQSEHCHFSKTKSSETLEAATSIHAFECCGLKFSFFVAKLEKKQFPHQTPALAYNFFNFLESVKPRRAAGFTGFSYRAPVPESRALHIKNCVFRI